MFIEEVDLRDERSQLLEDDEDIWRRLGSLYTFLCYGTQKYGLEDDLEH